MTGPGHTREDWDDVSDGPEITGERWAEARPLVEAMADLVDAMARRRGPQRPPTRHLVSLRLDRDVLATLRAGGSGRQSRANAMLRQGLGRDPQPVKVP